MEVKRNFFLTGIVAIVAIVGIVVLILGIVQNPVQTPQVTDDLVLNELGQVIMPGTGLPPGGGDGDYDPDLVPESGGACTDTDESAGTGSFGNKPFKGGITKLSGKPDKTDKYKGTTGNKIKEFYCTTPTTRVALVVNCANGRTKENGRAKCICPAGSCTPGQAPQCLDSNTRKECRDDDNDGCYSWYSSPCPSNYDCSNGACIASCDSCSVGQQKCEDGIPMQCTFNSAINCNQWVEKTEQCGNNFDACVMSNGQAICSNSAGLVCAAYPDSEECDQASLYSFVMANSATSGTPAACSADQKNPRTGQACNRIVCNPEQNTNCDQSFPTPVAVNGQSCRLQWKTEGGRITHIYFWGDSSNAAKRITDISALYNMKGLKYIDFQWNNIASTTGATLPSQLVCMPGVQTLKIRSDLFTDWPGCMNTLWCTDSNPADGHPDGVLQIDNNKLSPTALPKRCTGCPGLTGGSQQCTPQRT